MFSIFIDAVRVTKGRCVEESQSECEILRCDHKQSLTNDKLLRQGGRWGARYGRIVVEERRQPGTTATTQQHVCEPANVVSHALMRNDEKVFESSSGSTALFQQLQREAQGEVQVRSN
jgi:ribosomal protein L37AE/L43A